jgi:hypothetical protein
LLIKILHAVRTSNKDRLNFRAVEADADASEKLSLEMTEAEARLYNEINTKHIDGAFSSAGDKMLSVAVVEQMAAFLRFCRQRMDGQARDGRQMTCST